VMLAVLLAVCGFPPTLRWIAVVPIIILQFALMVAVSCLIAMAVPFMQDILNLVPLGIRFALFCSGVFYTLDVIPPQWQNLFLANPMANLLYQYRRVLVDGLWPDWAL